MDQADRNLEQEFILEHGPDAWYPQERKDDYQDVHQVCPEVFHGLIPHVRGDESHAQSIIIILSYKCSQNLFKT